MATGVCASAHQFHVRESKRKEVSYIYDAHYADRAALHIECTIYYQRREFIAHKLAASLAAALAAAAACSKNLNKHKRAMPLAAEELHKPVHGQTKREIARSA